MSGIRSFRLSAVTSEKTASPEITVQTKSPHLSISKLSQSLKEKSFCKLLQENKMSSKQFLSRHLWGRGYFVATSGNVTNEVIIEYIKIKTVNHNQKNILRLFMRKPLGDNQSFTF
jgi:putative transposase